MSNQFCSLMAAHRAGFLTSLQKFHGLAKEIMNFICVYVHKYFNIAL